VKINPFRTALVLATGLLGAASAWGFAYITNKDTGLPIKWPAGSIAIQIKLDAAGSTTAFNAAAQASAQKWNAQLGDLQITSTTAAAGAATDHNHVNELVFAADVFGQAFDTNVLAVTTTWALGNQRTEGDILFNSARTWGIYDGPRQGNTVDLKRVSLHEMGHLLGLDHPDDAGQTVIAIMNSKISDLDTLATDDITGVQNLYGPPGIPANDNFANAINLTPTNNAVTVTGFNTNATKEAGEPNHAGNSGGRSVWWKWTAAASGPVTLDTRGSYFDTTLGVYTGSALNNLTTVASNDDINPGIVQASSVAFTATGGTTYFIAVDGFNNNDGNGADSAGITVNLSLTSSGPTLPVITAQPVGVTVTVGGTASFTVTATGATAYQWQFNGNNISGATSATYTINSAQTANAGTYSVTVSNNAGSVTSNNAALTVTTPPPPPPPMTSGGGGGGGAPSLWFYGALSLLGFARFLRRHRALGAQG
jgi:hypothetical protein